jgi:ABC-type lipoprotein export system ATPase subunit
MISSGMEIFFNNKRFDTEINMDISYHSGKAMDEFVDVLIDQTGKTEDIPRKIGFVFPGFPMISNLSIIENIVLPLEYHRNLKTGEAVDMMEEYVKQLGIEGILAKRKENIQTSDLLKAMFLRAIALEPETVFFLSPQQFVPLKQFGVMLSLFRSLLRKKTGIWIGLSEGLRLSWDHDLEVSLAL